MSVKVHVFDNTRDLATQLAAAVAGWLRLALTERDRASLVVSGGRSPVALFQLLSLAELDWPRVSVTLADERWVEPSSAASNERMVREYLLQAEAAAAEFVPLKTAELNPDDALVERERAIAAMPRPFAVVVLGMGDDGHTASLFPESAGLAAAFDAASAPGLVSITPIHAPHRRISLNLSALLDSRHIALQIQGEAKHKVFERALAGAPSGLLPVAAVLQQARIPVDVYWAP